MLYKPSFDDISIFKISEEVPLALLYAMYALAARLVPPDTLNIPPETFLRVAEEELRSEGPFRSDSMCFYIIIFHCTHHAIVNTCTALFLLSLYYHGEGDQKQAWVHCG